MHKLSKTGLLAAILSVTLFSSVLYAVTPSKTDLLSEVSGIEDTRLRTTLENSIKIGIIANRKQLQDSIKKAEIRANNDKYQVDTKLIRELINKNAAPLAKLDKDALKAEVINSNKRLFADIKGAIPASYKNVVKLCKLFDPKTGTPEIPHNEKAIDAYFDSIKSDPCIVHALKVTKTTLADLKRNWFGRGAGFEHVIAGEIKGQKVSGYHFWFKFYADEREGKAYSLKSFTGNNSKLYTGQFDWDPDGSGPLPNCKKPKGGFSIGNSAQSLLALGHIAIEAAKVAGNNRVPPAFSFEANINGEKYHWQMYTLGGTIRSLYPMGAPKGKK